MALLSVVTAGLLGFGISLLLPRFGRQRIVIGAGAPDGETYIFMQAVKAVTERYNPRPPDHLSRDRRECGQPEPPGAQ